MQRNAKERNEAEATTKLWAKIGEEQENHYPHKGTKPSTVANQSDSFKVETAAVATDNIFEKMEQMQRDFDGTAQREMTPSRMHKMMTTSKASTDSTMRMTKMNSMKTKFNNQSQMGRSPHQLPTLKHWHIVASHQHQPAEGIS